MSWLPWRRHRESAAQDAERAEEALHSTQRAAPAAEHLAQELERIRRENNLAPRIAAAFRAHRAAGDAP